MEFMTNIDIFIAIGVENIGAVRSLHTRGVPPTALKALTGELTPLLECEFVHAQIALLTWSLTIFPQCRFLILVLVAYFSTQLLNPVLCTN